MSMRRGKMKVLIVIALTIVIVFIMVMAAIIKVAGEAERRIEEMYRRDGK